MTSQQRRAVLAICVIVGVTFLVSAGLSLLITPMASALSLTSDDVEVALILPSIASLLVIFLSGQLGDRVGHRPTMTVASLAFIAGSLLLALAQGREMVFAGLFLAGASATAIQIVALGLLQVTAPDGRAHVSAFTTYGAVFPVAYLIFPLATAQMLQVSQWRLVPLSWVVGGLATVVVARALLPAPVRTGPLGEVWTPLLAGLALTGVVWGFDVSDEYGWLSRQALRPLLVGIGAAVLCAVLMRHRRSTSLSLTALRLRAVPLLLVAIVIGAMMYSLSTFTLAMESLYGWSALDTARALIPAQIGAIIGAKMLAARAINGWGHPFADRRLFLVLAVAELSLVLVTADAPAWVLPLSTALISTAALTTITVLNTHLLGLAPEGQAGAVSAMRGAASAIGATLGVVVLGAGVIQAAHLDASETAPTAQIDAIIAGLRFDGIAAFVLCLGAWLLLRFTMRAEDKSSPQAVHAA